MRRAELISNSLSKDVTGKLQREVAITLASSPTIQEAAFTTFGTRNVSVQNLKVWSFALDTQAAFPRAPIEHQ